MAEVQARTQASSSRGRGGGRGGRGGYASRNGNSRRTNGDKFTDSTGGTAAFDDESDLGHLRKKFGSDKVETIKELFPDWSDADILYALQETDGDIEVAATRISEGTISQWGEVSKPKRSSTKPKAKESTSSAGHAESPGTGRPSRGARGDGGRGGRARGGERARGGRGRAASHAVTTNGHRSKENQQLSVPTEESSGWGNATAADDTTASPNAEWGTTGWGAADSTTETASKPTPTASTSADSTSHPTAIPSQATQKTWASMLRQSTAPKPAPKPKEVPAPKPAESIEPLPPAEPAAPEPEPQVEETQEETVKPAAPAPAEEPKIVEPEVALPLPEDDLTKQNLEKVPDESHPPATATVASTTADSWDARQTQPTSAAVTPLSASQAQHQTARPAPSGYAATALKATERPAARMPSYQRRLLEQEEAVRMPGNREVDRAAVQFGAFSLNGNEDDIDGDREDPETRGQPPLESPSQPRAALPPVPQQPTTLPESFPAAQKPAASLPQQSPTAGEPPVNSHQRERITNNHPAAPVAPPTGPAATMAQRMSQYPQFSHPTNSIPAPQAPSGNQQFGRFGQANTQDSTAFPQKPYEGFGQQHTAATSAGSFDSFPAATTQAPGPQNAFSSAPGDYSSYYTADQQGRSAYNYYGQYGQHGGQSHHEGPNSQSRAFGGYNASQNDNLSQYPQSGTQQSRFGAAASADAQNSGHNTPNLPSQTQPQQQSSAQANQPQSNLHQQPHGNQYPYAHPYFSSPYYSNYMQQFGGGYGQGGYGGAPYGKGGLYGQPHQYGMSPQGPYDHGTSPATTGFGQSSLGGRDSGGLGSSIDNYGRAGSTQSGAQGGLGGSGFGGIHDTFARGSAYPQGVQGFGNPNAQASNAASSNDDLKPYGESKAAAGPSPSLAAAARPGSATNNAPSVSGLPPPQSAQQGMGGYGGYPSHIQGHGLHGNQSAGSSYGLGGSGAQGHGTTPYGGFGGNQGFGAYYGGRQQGGWGGNYH
ncbi:hypothetical protein DL766_002313 [Monosporascus sp. MC13-8B]|nr:hypothetical protein DL763_001757 [Monosporascus cannonballus]RYP35846.1 hypothetical protein DL766_002313 [Monosporascus sp. MC13-8B]